MKLNKDIELLEKGEEKYSVEKRQRWRILEGGIMMMVKKRWGWKK